LKKKKKKKKTKAISFGNVETSLEKCLHNLQGHNPKRHTQIHSPGTVTIQSNSNKHISNTTLTRILTTMGEHILPFNIHIVSKHNPTYFLTNHALNIVSKHHRNWFFSKQQTSVFWFF